jgi:hypothetical protein
MMRVRDTMMIAIFGKSPSKAPFSTPPDILVVELGKAACYKTDDWSAGANLLFASSF